MKGCKWTWTVTWHWGKGIIDPAEFDGPEGALMESTLTCRLAVDPGHIYCPRHEMMWDLGLEGVA